MILRTYGCAQCNHMMTIELRSDQWDAEPPECPMCSQVTHQEFTPPGIVGSVRSKAVKLAEDIATNDYNVADFTAEGRPEGRPKVRYKDAAAGASSWGGVGEAALAQAVTLGRQTRLQHGSGLDIIKGMPDLIQESKKRSARIW